MSWMKQPPSGGGQPPPADPMFGPHQGMANQQGAYPNYQEPAQTNTQQQQYWQMPQQSTQYDQQYGQQLYQQQNYNVNANQNYQQHNQNFPTTQQGYQQNYPVQQQQHYYQQQQFPPTNQKQDGWEDNWDWGWDESSKQNQKSQKIAPPLQQNVIQQAAEGNQQFNNANVIEESFASNDTWNWNANDSKQVSNMSNEPASVVQPSQPATLPVEAVDPNLNERRASSQSAQSHTDVIKTLNDRDVVKEKIPNLALGKRFNLENLTPQWSIESQMSQDSSEGPHTHSESMLSGLQSRNSSSPGFYPETSHYSSNAVEDSIGDYDSKPAQRKPSNPDIHDGVISSMHELSLNRENPAPEHLSQETSELNNMASISSLPPPEPVLPVLSSPSLLPPPLPARPQAAVTPQPINPPGPSIPAIPPPPSNSTTYQSPNPFKNPGGFSHKSVKPPISLSNPFPPMDASSQRATIGFGANLETTPDNSERPDQPQIPPFRAMPPPPPVPENLEVAPRNDRNEYLQTEHLSSEDYNENTDFSCNVLPPGLQRMVVGQQHSEYQNLNVSGDEPPPGLSRMVPGQQTENDNSYNQSNDNYMDRLIDGQTTDTSNPRPFRQAEGQQTPDFQSTNRNSRHMGLDRMVPGEPSNEDFQQFAASGYGNDQRVVPGFDHFEPSSSSVREQNMDGSDYTDNNVVRRTIPAPQIEHPIDFTDDHQREVTMEGENLQDLSNISSTELQFSREHAVDGADVNNDVINIKADEEIQPPSSRRQSVTRITSGEDSERDRTFKSSPRKDRDKHKSSRDRDRERDRYRDDHRSERSEKSDRRSERDRRDRDPDRSRRERDESPSERRHKRSHRSQRYETEDTDYYSDRERERRRYREGSYTSSKPPRPEDKDRRHRDDRDRSRRYNTIERDRRYDDHDGPRRRDKDRERKDRGERKYRDIDPNRLYGSLRRGEDEERKRGDQYPSQSRPESREPTDEDDIRLTTSNGDARRRSDRRRREHRRDREYYDAAGYGGVGYDPYAMHRQQFAYYAELRARDPAAYAALYARLMADPHQYQEATGFAPIPFKTRPEERGSVHSGRSSANNLTAKDTYGYYDYRRGSLRDITTGSIRTDPSERDFNTDVSLGLQLDESTIRSERMTPFKFSSCHIKGNISSGRIVLVCPSYPVDGVPATVKILQQEKTQLENLLADYPGPLVPGVTHKKSVVEYCERRARDRDSMRNVDPIGYTLVWELLALLLRQNGVVVGSDIAELLMKNKQEYEYKTAISKASEGRRSASSELQRRDSSDNGINTDDMHPLDGEMIEKMSMELAQSRSTPDEPEVLKTFTEHLIYGNRQQALEYAMSNNLWSHALLLSSMTDRRSRAAVCGRFVSSLHNTHPLHTLYCTLAGRRPPAVTSVNDERGGDWRPHAAIILSNTSNKPEVDNNTLIQLGDTLTSRGLIFSGQFVLMSAGISPLSAKLPLLLSPRVAPPRLAATDCIIATEIYEYATGLANAHVIDKLQVYKFALATRLVDAGLLSRALSYTEAISRAVSLAPSNYSPVLLTHLITLADRLKYCDGGLAEDPPLVGEDGIPDSPQHQWIEDIRSIAENLTQSQPPSVEESPAHAVMYDPNQYGGWNQHNDVQTSIQYSVPVSESAPAPPVETDQSVSEPPPPFYPQLENTQYNTPAYNTEWYQPPPQEEQTQQYGDQYWQGDQGYGYNEEESRPQITMPGGTNTNNINDYDDNAHDDDEGHNQGHESDQPSKKDDKSKEDNQKGVEKKSGWLGGILTKLSLRPPNQMILPDDKNPTIVWDEDKKKWRNTDGSDDTSDAPPPPPPTNQDLGLHPVNSPRTAAPGMLPPTGTGNIYKMQKTRHIKKAYVDVFNPTKSAARSADLNTPPFYVPPAPQDSNNVPQSDMAPNYMMMPQ